VNDKGRVLSNVWDTYTPPAGWGIKPMDARKHHDDVAPKLLDRSLKEAKLSLDDIDLIAFSQGPGLPPCLHSGLSFARKLSKETGKPLIGVNHCISHIEIARLTTKLKDPVVLYVSGANTQILSFVEGRYRCFGETMDVGIGNALDKFGRSVGMEFPGGPKIEKLAKKGKYLELPYSVKGMDLSFSGIITEAIRRHKGGERIENLCFSLQETLFAMLTEVTERALAHTSKREVILTGGVAANQRLQDMLGIMCKERGARFSVVPRELAGDNGGMIAWTGILQKKAGVNVSPPENPSMDILPRQRTDEIDAVWVSKRA
jgi:N6-L-threonylcarbamoyladenine synthase